MRFSVAIAAAPRAAQIQAENESDPSMHQTERTPQKQSENQLKTSCAHRVYGKAATRHTAVVAEQHALLSRSAQTREKSAPNHATSQHATQAQTRKTSKCAAQDVKQHNVPSTHDARQRPATARAHLRKGSRRRHRQMVSAVKSAEKGVRATDERPDRKFVSKIVHTSLPYTGTQLELSQTQCSQRKNTEKPKHDTNATKSSQTLEYAFIPDVLQPKFARRSSADRRCNARSSAFEFLRTAKLNRTIKIRSSQNQSAQSGWGTCMRCRGQFAENQETFEIRILSGIHC